MVSFECDYNNGAHEEVLKRLIDTNRDTEPGYGADEYTLEAKEFIKKACGGDAEVDFLVGGTQTNAVVIDTMLKPYEGVIAATTGHINIHEAGAVEASGRKVLPVPGYQGKVKAEDVRSFAERFFDDESREHMVFPGMLYISHPTEYGTLYTKQELKELREICDRFGMKLFVDGARLAYGLAAHGTDVTLKTLAELADVFYIGGTKCGALCGEAVVFMRGNRPEHFVNLIKKHGALLAKGRLLGVQFGALFADGLYERVGKWAIDLADDLKKIFSDRGYRFFIDSPTNQQFIIMENDRIEKLKEKLRFEFWERYDANHTVVRFATSWATTREDLKVLEDALDEIGK